MTAGTNVLEDAIPNKQRMFNSSIEDDSDTIVNCWTKGYHITVLQAQNLPAVNKDEKTSDPSCLVVVSSASNEFQAKSARTEYLRKVLVPVWNQTLYIPVPTFNNNMIQFIIDDIDKGILQNKTNDMCESKVMEIKDLLDGNQRWIDLYPIGKVLIKVTLQEYRSPSRVVVDEQCTKSIEEMDIGEVSSREFEEDDCVFSDQIKSLSDFVTEWINHHRNLIQVLAVTPRFDSSQKKMSFTVVYQRTPDAPSNEAITRSRRGNLQRMKSSKRIELAI